MIDLQEMHLPNSPFCSKAMRFTAYSSHLSLAAIASVGNLYTGKSAVVVVAAAVVAVAAVDATVADAIGAAEDVGDEAIAAAPAFAESAGFVAVASASVDSSAFSVLVQILARIPTAAALRATASARASDWHRLCYPLIARTACWRLGLLPCTCPEMTDSNPRSLICCSLLEQRQSQLACCRLQEPQVLADSDSQLDLARW